jgi:hypothetical protein
VPAHRQEQVGTQELGVQVDLERLAHLRSNTAGAPRLPGTAPQDAPCGRIREATDGRRAGIATLTEELPMQLRHLPGLRTTSSSGGPPARKTDEHGRVYDPRVFTVQRIGALTVAAVILVFGLLGFAGGLDFFSTDGEQILGMSSNGLLSTISVVTAAVLVLAALRSPRTASTLMIVVGILFLLAGLLSLAVLRTDANVLAFEIENVIFSEVAGLTLLLLGAYGRVSGNLPADSPYARPQEDDGDGAESMPSTPDEFAAERAMREAEIAVVNHVATEDQRRRVEAMAQVHTRGDRRRVWMEFD